MYFDQNGDPAAMYELVNWQRNRAGEPMFVTVGNYDASLPNDKQFTMNGINITWAAEATEVGLWSYIYWFMYCFLCFPGLAVEVIAVIVFYYILQKYNTYYV